MNEFVFFQRTIGQIRGESKLKKQKVTKQQQDKSVAGVKKGRHVKWQPGNLYVCVRKATQVFTSVAQLDEMFQKELITEDCFCIFQHVDNQIGRNAVIPMYEAVYVCNNNLYYKVQKKHLKMAYTNSKKLDNSKAWTFDNQTKLPYWVDRFIFTRGIKN